MVPDNPKRLAEPMLTQINVILSLGGNVLTESVR